MYIVFDIGGTKTRIAASKDLQDFIGDPIIFDTPADYAEAITLMRQHIVNLAKDATVMGYAGGITGVLSPDNTHLVTSPHHSDWIHKPLASDIAGDTPIYLANDTLMVGLGEVTRGAGKDHRIVSYITISTGIGGARFVDSIPDQTHYGFEMGHHIVDHQKLTTFEDIASGTAMAARYNLPPADIMGRDIWEEQARAVAIGLVNVCYFWSPDCIILGGGMMKRDDQLTVAMIQPHLDHMLRIFPESPKLIKASLGQFGGLYGAMEYLKQKEN